MIGESECYKWLNSVLCFWYRPKTNTMQTHMPIQIQTFVSVIYRRRQNTPGILVLGIGAGQKYWYRKYRPIIVSVLPYSQCIEIYICRPLTCSHNTFSWRSTLPSLPKVVPFVFSLSELGVFFAIGSMFIFRPHRCGSTKTLADGCNFDVYTAQQRRHASGYVQSSRSKTGVIYCQRLCLYPFLLFNYRQRVHLSIKSFRSSSIPCRCSLWIQNHIVQQQT